MSKAAAKKSWFETEIDEPVKKMNHANNWPFFMEVDAEVAICILNADDERVPPVHYHEVWVDSKPKRVMCTAAEHLGGYCPLCEYTAAQPEGERWKTELKQNRAYTILVDYFDDKPPKKCLRMSTPADHQAIQRLRETAKKKMKKDGLQYLWLEVVRPSKVDKAPKIGKISTILSELDTSEYDAEFLAPFTDDELLVQFISDEGEMEEIYQEFSVDASETSKSKIRKVN